MDTKPNARRVKELRRLNLSKPEGNKEPRREPRAEVRRLLRQEVGFGCPIPGCGLPYLTWHHFDPPWNIRKHENPSGIIPLCRPHHDKADAGTWTKSQLREFKRKARQEREHVKGRFDWMRQQLLGVLGSTLVYNCPVLLYCCKQPVIWFERNSAGYLLVNLRMPRSENDVVSVLENNDWVVSSDVLDIESPPSGRLLDIRYPNGDKLKLEFRQIETSQDATKYFPHAERHLVELEYPLTSVSFELKVAALDITISPTQMKLPRGNIVKEGFAGNSPIGFALGEVLNSGGVAFNFG